MSGNWSQVTREGGWDYCTDLGTGQLWTRATGQATAQWIALPPVDATITRQTLNREFCTDANGDDWSRRVHRSGQRGNWTPVEKPIQEVERQPNNHLFLVRQYQSAGQPKHWSLVVAPEDGGRGKIYQVKGDALYMHYKHVSNIDIFVSQSYVDSLRICELDAAGEACLASVASSVRPPRAESQAHVRNNCQDWAVQVIQELENQNVVPRGSAANCASWHDYDSIGARLFQ